MLKQQGLNLYNEYNFLKELGIEVPIKSYDRTIFAFMVKKYDTIDNYFLIDRSNENLEKLRLLDKIPTSSRQNELPKYVAIKEIEWDKDGIIGYRKKGGKIEGLCAFLHAEKKFKPSWELLENIKPGNEQEWKTSKKKKTAHFEDMMCKSEVLKCFFK
ncbi:unnamed protein product [Brachionus calyciflorus]|uniref:Uncharacterized protein n=1 Tax=Brachionus calyciflorus TaxID=104777 RepID=A0A814BAC7_9BILA|nr:unnamed protein product [Brachionus calyciflorus]